MLIIYSMDIITNHISTIVFNDFEKLKSAVKTIKPDAVILPPGRLPEESFDGVIKVVVGEISEADLQSGADFYFKKWSDDVIKKIEQKKQKLSDAHVKNNTDALTGLPNRNLLKEFAEKQRNYSLMICDIDHFKKVNDTYGHQVGDEVLRAYSAHLRSSFRDTDFVARYGGEEFVVIFPATSKENAEKAVQKARQSWQAKKIYKSTFSAGIAEKGTDGETLSELVEQADKALYMAKKTGRNKVCMAGGPELEDIEVISTQGTKVYAVVGAAPRVGATTFALALAGYLARSSPVEILDAGGGALGKLRDTSTIPTRKWEYSITPGVTSIIDCGTEIPDLVRPFVNFIFVVSDMSKDARDIERFVSASNVALVGNRGAVKDDIDELASFYKINSIILNESPEVRLSEKQMQLPNIKAWKRPLKQVDKMVKKYK